MQITGKNYIGNQLLAEGKITFQTTNPITNLKNDWICVEATAQEIEQATSLAWSAFKIFRKTSDEKRADFLNQIANEIENLGEQLLQTYCLESALPESRAKVELKRTLFQLRSFAEFICTKNWRATHIDFAEPERIPQPKLDLRKTFLPLGPVAVFSSSNFPFAYSTAGGDTASAFAAGCPVLVKSHPMHAGTGELVASAIIKAAQKTGMPNGVFSNLNSSGIDVGIQLVKDKNIKAVGFTGSIRGGRALFDLANQRPEPIPVFAEMGSINPVVISQKSLEKKGEHWATTYANSITLGTGQFCTSPGLVLGIDSPAFENFAKDLAEKIIAIQSTCMLHPSIKKSFSKLKTEVSTQPNVAVLTAPLSVQENFADQTIAIVNGADFLANTKLHQEVFGPFSLLVKCTDEAELLAIIENLEGQLTGTIISEEEELKSLSSIIDELQNRVGRLIFNGVPTGVEVCPAMQHGGPYPASTDSRFTAVGTDAIQRWLRPIAYQNFPQELLPSELKD